ncbi:glycosyltransferase [Aureimonas pseudogalii]|uniref:Erythromycin biosynthesis protein CIII-like C-terminal domain-containing protein n=1 Tax=Aureimonas pseudogalii TaxID=1744844 RepID=A0A7W6MM57_9HYPH|nr:nucleotide disphospho-sugar-binding domain-containing protein [Aureimonas pseudogalii]MBB4000454.1 hypothetical protein [Aureimonas pseudogalii]
MTRPRRALLAWEFGAGRTHVLQILGLARHLREAGVECLAALYEPSLRDEFAAIGVPVIQTYVWPGRRRLAAGWHEGEVRAFGDVLVHLGMTFPGALGAALTHYDGVFALFQPDVVLGDNAPGALLAARGRVPAIAFGTNATLPPVRDGRFALRPDTQAEAAMFDERDIRDALNVELGAAGRPCLSELTDLLPAGSIYPFGPPAFDTYAAQRETPALPPYLAGFERPTRYERGEGVFAYLHGFVQGASAILDGLSDAQRATTLYLPGLMPAVRERLGPAIRVSDRALPQAWILSGPRCVLHHGGLQLTTACLAAGRPQVILAKELDNEIAGRFVGERGLGFACHVTQADAAFVREAVRAAHDDDLLAARCREAAAEFLVWTRPDPTRIVADAARRLLQRP